MKKEIIKYIIIAIFLLTQLCIARSLYRISRYGVPVYISNFSIDVNASQSGSWYISH